MAFCTEKISNSIYEILKSKDIIAILDGDSKFGLYSFDDGGSVPVAMPYLSGPDLCGLCTMFGLPKTYSPATAVSRWQYLSELIEHCSKNNTCAKLLNYLFSKDRFSKIYVGRGKNEIEKSYNDIINIIIDKINGILSFSNHELVMQEDVIDLVEIGAQIAIEYRDFGLKKGTIVLTAFNTYELEKQIGQGGNGKVWKAVDKENQNVAIKFLSRENTDKVLKRFKNETFFCMKHSHKNIIPILDYGTAGKDFVFYVMPLYEQTLRNKMKEKINHADIINIFVGILNGLQYAHKNGAIHRDIKPENILFAEGSWEPVIADFGIAHFTDENLETFIETAKGDRMANFQYAAPEQKKKGGTVSPQTDIYSAGLLLNEMFTGEIPQAINYKKIADVSAEYAYLDELFELLFQQEPSERLYPEEKIIMEIKVLAQKHNNNNDIKQLEETSFELQQPEDYEPKVISIRYEKDNLIFELDKTVNADWLQVITNGAYTHSFVMGYDTNKLRKHKNNMIAMPMRLNESQNTIKSIVENVKSWITMSNGLYRDATIQRLMNEQAEKERARLDEIKRLEKVNEMSDFLSTLL